MNEGVELLVFISCLFFLILNWTASRDVYCGCEVVDVTFCPLTYSITLRYVTYRNILLLHNAIRGRF
jgi:predicted membrane chloride channel (bestrophin family)